ncbi:uncharacterized protein LOC6575388 [Drosophila mojavensis]|uniref:TIL domain-containing protein n=1 Tax=Drosophila mojavensis TaxID=7230 RepID=B4KBD3_DROMO|nr:uncharacterized protein LOC6575388 [Drosophila mojavensis]EDW16861.1 uncharacterized protein Dmoj_GI21999 [Drosophila mojavensis]
MKSLLILLALCAGCLLCNGEGLLSRLLHRDASKTTTTTTTTEKSIKQLYINNNLPQLEPQCIGHYACSKKLTNVPAPRPCVKYCLKRIECPNQKVIRGKPNQCVELDESQVLADYEATTVRPSSAATTEKIMEVAMIDFPCQPGYLPDSRGRCREIW